MTIAVNQILYICIKKKTKNLKQTGQRDNEIPKQ